MDILFVGNFLCLHSGGSGAHSKLSAQRNGIKSISTLQYCQLQCTVPSDILNVILLACACPRKPRNSSFVRCLSEIQLIDVCGVG